MYSASFLSGGFITAIVVNPPERKLPKCTSVHWSNLHFSLNARDENQIMNGLYQVYREIKRCCTHCSKHWIAQLVLIFTKNCMGLNLTNLPQSCIFAFWVLPFFTLPTHLFAFLVVLLFIFFTYALWKTIFEIKHENQGKKVVRKQSKKNFLMFFMFACWFFKTR